MWRDCILIYIDLYYLFFLLFCWNIVSAEFLNPVDQKAGVDWDPAEMLHPDFGIPDICTPRPQTPPSKIADVPNTTQDFSQR